jgi:tRNA threonylcarbamoyladenosine biosynthesis protein TsaB
VLLAVDTSTSVASIALFQDGVLAELTWHAGADQTRQLLPRIHETLTSLGRSPADLTALGVALGPGSFNGLRVGIATVKSISMTLGLPLVGVETLRVTAYAFRLTYRPVRPLFDAGRNEVATGLYQASEQFFATLEEPRICTLDTALAASPPGSLFCGELRPAWRERIAAHVGHAEACWPPWPNPAENVRRAGYLAELAWQLLRAGIVSDAATLQPLYLRRPPVDGAARPIGSAAP